MAKISGKGFLVSAGFGVLDIAAEMLAPAPVIVGLNGPDVLRLAAALGAGVINYTGYERDFSEPLFYSALPLAEKTIYSMVKGAAGGATFTRRASEMGFVAVSPSQVSVGPQISSY